MSQPERVLVTGADGFLGSHLTERLLEHAETGSRAFHLHANKVRYGRTGDDGIFRSHDALPPGTHELRISGDGLTLVEPKTITIPADQRTLNLSLDIPRQTVEQENQSPQEQGSDATKKSRD